MPARYFHTIPGSVTLLALATFAANLPGQENSSYVLGVDDQIMVQALHVPSITDKPIRIDKSGFITLPLAGRVRAAGLSVHELERSIRAQLDSFIHDPEVSVSVIEFRSQPISVIGAVTNPGVYQLQGSKTLLELLAMAGGSRPDAADTVRITRRTACGPTLPNAHPDATRQFMVAEISLRQLLEASNPAGNVAICASDVVTIPRARLIYVLGDVRKPGGFPLRDEETATVLQALSMAEGTLRTAAFGSTRILRLQEGGGKRMELPVNLKAIMDAKAPDMAMQPDDILVIPNSATKTALIRAAEAAIQVGTGVVIWRR